MNLEMILVGLFAVYVVFSTVAIIQGREEIKILRNDWADMRSRIQRNHSNIAANWKKFSEVWGWILDDRYLIRGENPYFSGNVYQKQDSMIEYLEACGFLRSVPDEPVNKSKSGYCEYCGGYPGSGPQCASCGAPTADYQIYGD